MAKTLKNRFVKKVLLPLSFLLICISILNQYSFSKKITKTLAFESNPEEEILFWENFINKNPKYIDGLIRLAVLEAKRGNTKKALNYWYLAYKVDPNAKSVVETKKLLGL